MAPRLSALAAVCGCAAAAAGAPACGAGDSAAAIATGHDLTGKVIVLTGGDSGIGYETALALAPTQATLLILSYDAAGSGAAAAANITRLTGNANIVVEHIDLSSLDSVRKCAATVLAKYQKLDYLLCDAGVGGPDPRQLVTSDGFNRIVEVNYIGHFLLIDLLLPALRSSGAGVVVSVSSGSGYSPCDGLDADCTDISKMVDVATGKASTSANTYGLSKYMQIYHARELAAREAAAGSSVRIYAMRPGLVDTPMERKGPDSWRKKICQEVGYKPCPIPASNVGTLPYLVVDQQPQSSDGQMFFMCKIEEQGGKPYGPAFSAAQQKQLYDLSVKWVAK